MAFLPSLACSFWTDRTPEDVRFLLKSVTVQRKWSVFPPDRGTFIGEIADYEFKIIPVLSYRNSFVPVIKGLIRPDGRGTRIFITMKLHGAVTAFCTVWFGFVLFFMPFGVLLVSAEGFLQALPILLGPAAMFLGGQALVRFGFGRPAEQSRKKLMELLG